MPYRPPLSSATAASAGWPSRRSACCWNSNTCDSLRRASRSCGTVTSDALADLLEEAWQLRREQLPALIFNATLGSDEYQAFWLAVPAPGQYPRVSRTVAAAALDAINTHTRRWLGGDYQAQNRDFEILLGEVAGGDGGALLQARADRTDRSHQQLLPPIADLEAQLNTALPQRYRRWMDERNQRLAELASASCHHLKQFERIQQPCAAE